MALMRVIDNLGESREEGSLDREQGTGLGVAYPGVTFGRAFLGQRTPPPCGPDVYEVWGRCPHIVSSKHCTAVLGWESGKRGGPGVAS